MKTKSIGFSKKWISKLNDSLENWKKKSKTYIKDNKIYLKYFIIIWIIYVVALIPLFRANFNYIDDLGRKFAGYRNFKFNRDTSNFLSIFIHTSKYLTDISPFTQILACGFVALTSAILIKVLTRPDDKNKFNIWYVFGAIPVGLSPYFLENLSYKFDSPYMALSVLVSVIPFLFYKKDKKFNLSFIIINIICTLIMCTTYQSSSGIFLSVMIVLGLLMLRENISWKSIFNFIITSILSFGIGLLIFKLFIMDPVNSYVDNSIFPLKKLFSGSLRNYKVFLSILKIDFKKEWVIAIYILAISFIITNIIRSENNKLVTFDFSILALSCLGLLLFGLYPFIQKPLMAPRSMYGTGICISLIAMLAIDYKKAYVPKILSLYLSYCFFVLALTYGNALAEQKRYTEYRIGLVASDLNNIDTQNNKALLISIKGSIGKPNSVKNLIKHNTILNRLIPETFGDDEWNWASFYFYNYYNLPNSYGYLTDFNPDQSNLYLTTRYHDIYLSGNKVLIILKD